jgi:hypothetical protein
MGISACAAVKRRSSAQDVAVWWLPVGHSKNEPQSSKSTNSALVSFPAMIENQPAEVRKKK